MGSLLLLTGSADAEGVLPALGLLNHRVTMLPPHTTALIDAPTAAAALVDGRLDLARARSLTRLIRATGIEIPLLLVVTEGGLAVVSEDWGMDDVILQTAGPAEVDARLRLASGRLLQARGSGEEHRVISASGLQVDEAAYAAKLEGRALNLTFKEFELIKFLAQHPGRVFTRQQLLQEVWGYDYFGGTRTVDVHVRRLRAKLGTDHETLIGTVRNVGYRFVARPERSPTAATSPAGRDADGQQPAAGMSLVPAAAS